MERTLIAQSTPVPVPSPTFTPSNPYPNFSVPSGGIIAQLPSYTDSVYMSQLQLGFAQGALMATSFVAFAIVAKFLNSLRS